MKYDFLIVGSGIYGATCANLLHKKGYRCIVIERDEHIGGHCRTENRNGIDVHLHGAHIFNTSYRDVWEWIQEFGEFNNYVHKVIAKYGEAYYSMPINLMTFQQIYGSVDPNKIQEIVRHNNFIVGQDYSSPKNFKEYVINKLGWSFYKVLFEGYTKKQWHKDPSELPESIAKRIPVRYTFDDRYFFSKYQGIPIDGYSQIIKNMLSDTKVILSSDYFKERDKWNRMAHKVIYTGKLDQFFDYKYGNLDYLTLRFEHEKLKQKQYQGNSVINYTEEKIPYTRIIEHNHFNKKDLDHTIITKEYSEGWNTGRAYYPLNDDKNNAIAQKYKEESSKLSNIHIGGRLGCYKYFDMDDSIKEAMKLVERIS